MKGLYTILLFNCLQCLYDFCLVWSSEVARHENYYKLAALCHHFVFVEHCSCGIFLLGSGQPYWVYRQWRSFFIDTVEDNSGGDYSYYFHCIYYCPFKGESLHWNHFAAFICLVLAVYFVFYK